MPCSNILLVEDDDDIRESIADFLTFSGYHIIPACNGQQALECLRTLDAPCLVLLDLMMPVMNGQEFLKIKQHEVQIAPIPVVVVSAIADRSSLSPSNVKGFVKKPIDVDVLLRVVEQYCQQMP